MVCVVRLFHSGVVEENGEFGNMEEVVPTLQEVVDGARRNFRCGRDVEMMLRDRVHCAKGVVSNLSCEVGVQV